MLNELLIIGTLLLPIIIYLIILRSFDAFSLARWRLLAQTFLWGICSALLVLGCVHLYRYIYGHPWTEWFVSPLLEETLKVLPLIILIYKGKMVFFAESQIYGQMIGGGFAFMENLFLYIISPDMFIGTALIRGFGTSLLHMGCTSMLASALIITNNSTKPNIQLLSIFYILPILFHAVYNIPGINPAYQLMIVVIVFFLIFLIMEKWNANIIGKWLDLSLNDDIKLMAALKEGKLLETKAGSYLQSIKEKFEPLVFFDMIAYVCLYLDLLIEAKSEIMLQEAGITMPQSEEKKKERNEKFNELRTLRSRIPTLGRILLLTITHTNEKDIWALKKN